MSTDVHDRLGYDYHKSYDKHEPPKDRERRMKEQQMREAEKREKSRKERYN